MKAKLFVLLSCIFIAVEVMAEGTTTIDVTFKDFARGSSYAENEKHDLGGGLVIYTTLCHFTDELRIYSSATYNGFVVSEPLPGRIASLSFNMGYAKDVLNVYGSADKENWTLIKGIETTTTSYKNYKLDIPAEKNFTCFKLDVAGEKQIRVVSMSVTYVKGDESDDKEEIITISAPVFNPISTSFSSESLEVTMDAAEGCEIYYTTDGTTPSYTNAEEYNGTKGNVVVIYASDNKVTLQAIAVNPTTEKCSSVSSATYTYKESLVVNDGESKARAYTVAEVKSMTVNKSGEKWVRGTIYGTMVNSYITEITTTNFSPSDIVIGDEITHIPVQLVGGTDIRNEINLRDHPYLRGKDILIRGSLESYANSPLGVKEPSAYQITYDIPINSYGYASLYLDMPVLLSAGSTAYYCIVDGDRCYLYPVGDVIPAGIGVIVSSTPNIVCSLTYTTQVNPNQESILAKNQLIGFAKDSVVVGEDYDYYALNVKDNRMGFYKPQTATNGGFVTKANKAYLRVPKESEATMFTLHRKDETLIVSISQMCDDVIYDLQGRVVSSPVSGVYIIGGKKVVIK